MAKVAIPEYPDNSDVSKEKKEEVSKSRKDEVVPAEDKKVIQGNVIKKKKGVFRKMADTFFAGRKEDIGNYILNEVLMDHMKDTLSDVIDKSKDMMLYGDTRATGHGRRSKTKSSINESLSYNRISHAAAAGATSRRNTLNFDDIILESRGDAERVLDDLLEKIEQYEVATVADLYDAVAISHDFTHTKYGWYDLSDAYVKRTREGYCVILPKAQDLR